MVIWIETDVFKLLEGVVYRESSLNKVMKDSQPNPFAAGKIHRPAYNSSAVQTRWPALYIETDIKMIMSLSGSSPSKL